MGNLNLMPLSFYSKAVNVARQELEFTVVSLQILVWIYVNAIHSRVFILDLPANIDF
jgi:hypothetical protein